jgi:hypothetical protein
MAAPDLAEVSLRDRAWWAACRIHGADGAGRARCEMGGRITDAVLAEVRIWLLERAAALAMDDEISGLMMAEVADQVSS